MQGNREKVGRADLECGQEQRILIFEFSVVPNLIRSGVPLKIFKREWSSLMGAIC